MKQIHTLFIIALSVLALTSCRDDFDIKTVKAEPRVILYCMPTAGDTTAIQLMRSLPVNQTGQVVPIDGARISYTVNGQPATIIAEGNGHYKAVARKPWATASALRPRPTICPPCRRRPPFSLPCL